jgi:mono/diheme cytochrome c family protein
VVAVITRVASGEEREALTAFAKSAPVAMKTHIESILAGPKVMKREKAEVPERFHAGREAYMKACVECHQADGRGVERTFPPLLGSEWVKGDRDRMLRILLGGLSGPIEVNGKEFNGVMPGHSHVGNTEIAEIAEIASFVRYAFGDLDEEPIPEKAVETLRPEVNKRKYVPWTVKELNAASN